MRFLLPMGWLDLCLFVPCFPAFFDLLISLSPKSPVNLGFDLEQIATEMIFAGSNSLNSASQHTKSLRKSEHRKTTKFDIFFKE